MSPSGCDVDGAGRTLRDTWRLFLTGGFVRVDNGFTNGWSIQRHTHQRDAWDEMEPSKFSGWISRTIPGLNDLPFESVNPLTGLTWGNITFEYRF